LGWLPALFGAQTLEYFSPETFSFMELYGPPHLPAARALLLVGLTLYLTPGIPGRRNLVRGGLAGAALLGAWLFQPLDVPLAWAVMGAHLGLVFLRTKRTESAGPADAWKDFALRGAAALAVTLPAFLYSALAFTLDPVLRAWTAQNQVPSLEVWQYLSAYGLVFAPAVAGAWIGRRDTRALLPAGWILILPVLLIFPIGLNRRLGIEIPEADYRQLTTLDVIVDYLAAKLPA
jgi:hypothetical protein